MRKKIGKLCLYASLILGGISIACVIVFFNSYFALNKKNVPEKFILQITPSTTYEALIDTLTLKLSDIRSFKKAIKQENPSHLIEPGRYQFEKDACNKNIVRAILNGWQTPFRLTLSGNIRGKEKLAGILGKRLMYDSAGFSHYFNHPQTWEKYGFTEQTFISLFIPNTYEMYWTSSPEEFTERMKKEYDKFWTSERIAKAKKLNMTKEEVSTLASIVCEESNYKPELATIAGVYINRLKKGMKLDADPTVKYALNDPGLKRILYKHLEVDSPYNTYKNNGLPPGPITIPSIDGIDAVLNYKEHNYLYFCANSSLNGTHKFATNLTDHNKNARAYQAAINRLQ